VLQAGWQLKVAMAQADVRNGAERTKQLEVEH
jgi:hypothetical protein